MTAGELLQQGRERLADVSSSAALDVRWLLCQVLGIDELALFRAPERPVSEPEQDRFLALLARRAQGEPVAYLLGQKDFYGATFKVTPATLIPRPETELLVDVALAALPEGAALTVADLGTGSGILALTLARLRPAWQLLALDRSESALAVAQENAKRQACGNVHFLLSDWLTEVTDTLDAIVCNPPYIAASDHHLDAGDVRFEPRAALVSGDDGLADFRRIIAQSQERLATSGWLAFEHGFEQGQAVRDLLHAAGFMAVQSHRDLAGHERVTEGRRPC